jgi:hypothetical protein
MKNKMTKNQKKLIKLYSSIHLNENKEDYEKRKKNFYVNKIIELVTKPTNSYDITKEILNVFSQPKYHNISNDHDVSKMIENIKELLNNNNKKGVLNYFSNKLNTHVLKKNLIKFSKSYPSLLEDLLKHIESKLSITQKKFLNQEIDRFSTPESIYHDESEKDENDKIQDLHYDTALEDKDAQIFFKAYNPKAPRRAPRNWGELLDFVSKVAAWKRSSKIRNMAKSIGITGFAIMVDYLLTGGSLYITAAASSYVVKILNVTWGKLALAFRKTREDIKNIVSLISKEKSKKRINNWLDRLKIDPYFSDIVDDRIEENFIYWFIDYMYSKKDQENLPSDFNINKYFIEYLRHVYNNRTLINYDANLN